MRVLIVAKTRMGGGACIGAITETGKSVRLIPCNADPHDGANREYEVGDIWEITAEPVPASELIPPHNENIVVHKKRRLGTAKDTKDLVSAIELLMPPKIGDPRELYDGLLKSTGSGSLYLPPRGDLPSYSTTFWRPNKPLVLESEQQRNPRYHYPTESGGCTLTFVGYQRPVLEIIPAGTLLRVSLTQWGKPRNTPNLEERCSVQLSGWFLERGNPEEVRSPPERRKPPSQTETPSLEILRNVFGHDQFLPFQEEIIEGVRKGKDALVVLPTGGGKSICYQLPACAFNGLTVVVSPLIALMQDQVMQLENGGIRAAFLNHTVEEDDYVATMQEVRSGNIKLLYLAPETLVQRAGIQVMLYNSNVACLAIDEAHCISQWGHDFRPNYRELNWVREQFPNAVCITLTATATPRVREDIRQSLNIPEENQFIGSFNRENLFISVEPRFELIGQTLAFLQKHTDESGIIYCQRRKHVDWLCENLKEYGISALPYHAGLPHEIREQNQNAFINGEIRVIVATIAFGMGIDKPDVRFVLHAWLPKDLESYYQEIGRSGRDGECAECLLLFSPDDEDTITDLMDDGHPSQREGRIEALQKLIAWATSEECRRKALLDYFGEQYENENCGLCDNCLKAEIELVDLTIPAQKFLSCIARVEESSADVVFDGPHFIGTLRDGNTSIPLCLPSCVLYMIDILQGERQKQIIENNHDQLSTWAIGRGYNKAQWYYLALQFLQHDLFLYNTRDGSIRLTDRGRETNTRNVTPEARFWGFPVDSVTLDFETSITAEPDTYESDFQEENNYDHALFQNLRDRRRRIAETEKVQASRVMPTDSLREIAATLPQTEEEFRQIHGVGEVRMQYADDFLRVIRAYCEANAIDLVESENEVPFLYEPASTEPTHEVHEELFELLRAKRKTIVEAEGVPAFVAFSDKTLKEMATYFPQTKEALMQIHGAGPAKVEKYADIFLPIIRVYCKEHGID